VKVVTTFDAGRTEAWGRSALVPTMGALHEGHTSLVSAVRERADSVVMSVFVNPLQFDDQGDLDRYPRDIDSDARIAEQAGVDVLVVPTVEDMYPSGSQTTVAPGRVAEHMEGAHRPGHFEGVATVVAKLFAGLRPDLAAFGRKDAQQLAVVRRLALDLSFPVEIVAGSTVREADGLAMSSRNAQMTDADRTRALALSAALMVAADAVRTGERRASELEGLVRERLEDGGLQPEYVTLADGLDAVPVDRVEAEAFLATAARVGNVRLIDNVFLWPDGTVDVGVQAVAGRS